MRTDFEDRLRGLLADTAHEAGRSPESWQRLQQRIRRRQTWRWTVTGLATAAVALVAIAVVAPLLSRTVVDLAPAGPGGVEAPAPATDPAADADDGEAPVSATPTAACGSIEQLAVVYVDLGNELVGVCVDGAVVSLTPQADEAWRVAVAPDGRAIVYERAGAEHNELVWLDTATGERIDLGTGRLPVYSANYLLAWVEGLEGDGEQQVIHVAEAGRPTAPLTPIASLPVGPEGAEELSVRNLAWDADERHLYVQAGHEGDTVFAVDVFAPDPTPVNLVPSDRDSGGTYVGPSGMTEWATAGLVHRCCVTVEGDQPTVGELVTVAFVPDGFDGGEPVEATVADLDELPAPGFDAGSPDVYTVWGGPGPVWLVGDGHELWRIPVEGQPEHVASEVQHAAANPAAWSAAASDEPAIGPVEVQVFFSAMTEDSADCGEVAAVTRTVQGPAVLRGALQALLAGPTPAEQEQGLSSMFSSETASLLRDVRLTDGVAYVDFQPELPDVIPNASTSCGSAALLAQLDATVTQFASVDRVVYLLAGSECAFGEWLQIDACP